MINDFVHAVWLTLTFLWPLFAMYVAIVIALCWRFSLESFRSVRPSEQETRRSGGDAPDGRPRQAARHVRTARRSGSA